MSYYNQREHKLLDRQLIRDLLLDFSRATVKVSPVATSRAEHLDQLMRLCRSELERDWLRFLEEHNMKLPSHAQKLIPECGTRPDFVYDEQKLAVYVDGPHHRYSERAARDQEQKADLEDRGWTIARMVNASDWMSSATKHAQVFGLK